MPDRNRTPTKLRKANDLIGRGNMGWNPPWGGDVRRVGRVVGNRRGVAVACEQAHSSNPSGATNRPSGFVVSRARVDVSTLRTALGPRLWPSTGGGDHYTVDIAGRRESNRVF